ncbi:MAG: hypothetical protein ISR72_03380 [Methylobacter sp.]|nr:hypothetical protein [Methylobacter sp.]
MFKFTITRTSLLALTDSLSSMSPLAETDDIPPGPGCIYQQADEKIFMLPTIPYDDTGTVNDFLSLGNDRAFVRNRYLLVNGQIAPTITIQPGDIQRWRFIDSSFNRNF